MRSWGIEYLPMLQAIKKAPLAGAFFDGLFSPLMGSLLPGFEGRCGLSAAGSHSARR